VEGIIFNGPSNPESEDIILKHSKYRPLLRIAQEEKVDRETVLHYAHILKRNWK
jgi:dethiobiotin synthetase